jgi:outer membrane protein TolC
MVAHVNRSLAADLGFEVATVAAQLRGMVEGVVPTKLRDGEEEYDIRVRLAPEFRNDFAAIARTPLYSPRGAAVRTGDIVRMEPGVGPANIEREQRRRQAKIGIELDDRPLGDVTRDLEAMMATVQLPPNFEWGFAGDVEMMQESASAMGLAMILAIAFIYIVLASQFESFTEPFLIMLSLPLAVVGALLALLFTGNNIGMPAMIGVVMLMGLVTKNAILLVDLTNHYHREEGLSIKDAILKAGPIRLRPILMTTFAMILGMMPSATATGDGAEFRAPISIATIGGLITSTALTLVVVPVAYLLLARILERAAAWRRTSPARFRQATRIAGALLLLVLAGWFWGTSTVFGQTPAAGAPAPMTLTFDDARQRALAANENLKVVAENVRIGEARVAEAKAAFLPDAAVTLQYQPWQKFPEIRIPAGVFGPEEQTFEAAFARQNTVTLGMSQPLYTGGRLTSNRDLQRAALTGSELDLERARQQLELRVVEAFYGALTNEQSLKVAEEGITLAARQLELARVRFEAGSVARLDVLRAEVDLANARARRIQVQATLDQAYQSLRTVLALPQSQPLTLRGTLDDLLVPESRDDLSAALPSRPDLLAFGSRREMAEYAVSLANSEWKPTLAFTGNVAYQDDSATSLLNWSNQNYQFGVAIRMPLFAAPASAARRGIARAQMRQAEHGLNAALDAGRLELETAWTDLQAATEVVATQVKALDLARESVTIAEVSYENGVITSAELNDAQVALLQTDFLLQQAKYARIMAAARARFAAGT